jgi:hypothetical protein
MFVRYKIENDNNEFGYLMKTTRDGRNVVYAGVLTTLNSLTSGYAQSCISRSFGYIFDVGGRLFKACNRPKKLLAFIKIHSQQLKLGNNHQGLWQQDLTDPLTGLRNSLDLPAKLKMLSKQITLLHMLMIYIDNLKLMGAPLLILSSRFQGASVTTSS